MRQVVELARATYGKSAEERHETGWLALKVEKARVTLSIKPKWALTESVNRTMTWYRAKHAGADARNSCVAEIAAYEALP